jgi:hypothetical protein
VRRSLVAVLLAGLAACSHGDDTPRAVKARIPDVEGVVTAADRDSIDVAGHHYVLADDASSVSTYTLKAVPLRLHTLVHAGLDDRGLVQWVATIGLVSTSTPPRVRYTGTVRSVSDSRAVFTDGTALRVAPDLHLPTAAFIAVQIDPTTATIVSFTRS